MEDNLNLKEQIHNLYWNQGLSQKEIGELLNKRQQQIFEYMRDNNIKVRTKREVTLGKRNPFYGKHHSEETKKIISNFRINKPMSEDTKKRISNTTKGRPCKFKGKKYEEILGEEKAKNLRKLFQEQREGNKNSFYGKHHSQNTKDIISKKNKERLKNKENHPMFGKKRPDTTKLNKTPEHRRKILKGLIKKPSSFEKKIIDLCKKYGLPFYYTGNGSVIIDGLNPDFIGCNGEKKIIETYCIYWHPKNYRESRTERLGKLGFDVLFLDDKDLDHNDWESDCLEKIQSFTMNNKER